jgi:drug/metabolite transporter (DMT)-like permease
MPSSSNSGNYCAILAASLFGAVVVVTRVVVQEIPPINLAVLRFSQGGLVLFICLSVFARHLLRVRPSDLPFLALLGGIMFAAFPVSFHLGVSHTGASRAALMLATMPIWSAILARLAGKERLNARQISGILLTFAGMGLVLAERGINLGVGGAALIGDGFMLLTALCGAVYGILGKRMLAKYPALTVTAYAMIFGVLLLLPAAMLGGMQESFSKLQGSTAWLVAFLGIIGGALGFLLWTTALTRLSPTQVAVYANLNPLVAAILGVILLGERLNLFFAAGFLAVVAGVLLVNRNQRPAVPLAHETDRE